MKKLITIFAVIALFYSSSTVSPVFAQTNRNMLLEYCTGTWCQYCPCGHSAIEVIKQYYPQSIFLAYHGPANSSDPWDVFNGNGIIPAMGFSGYPTGIFDRTNAPGSATSSSWVNRTVTRYTLSPTTPVNFSFTAKNYNTSTRELSVTVKGTPSEVLSGTFKINFAVTEDNLVYPQTGNSGCPGSSTYVHEHIVRNLIGQVTGDDFKSGTWAQGEDVTKTITTTIDAGWVADNCHIVAFVFKDSTAGLPYSEVMQAIQTNVTGPLVGIHNTASEIPSGFKLEQNYPNPFNPVTNIKFSVPRDGQASLKIYDVLGNEVATYLDEFLKAGTYNATIDGTNMSSGVYFYKLVSGNFSETKKMLLTK